MSTETANTIRHAADVIQWLDLAVWLAILLLSLGAHNVVFYLVALLVGLPGPVASLWSAVRVLHVALVILAVLVAAFAVARSPDLPGWVYDEDGPYE